MQPLFRYSAKDTFLIAQTLVTLSIAFGMAMADVSIVWWVITAPLHILLVLNIQNSSTHHHTHWPTFNSKLLNQLYDLVIAAASGSKPQTYRLTHSLHHKFVNDSPVGEMSKDPISVFGHGVNGHLENVWKFCWRNGVFAWSDPWRYVFYQAWQAQRPKTGLMNYTLWRREQIVIVCFFLAVLSINIAYGLWLLFAIYLSAHFLNYAWHYGEHYGSYDHRGDTTQDAVGIYSWWYNFLFFNAGYHQEHHHKPGVHWTRQPEVTKLLPASRRQVGGMHITNIPWTRHLRLLFDKTTQVT